MTLQSPQPEPTVSEATVEPGPERVSPFSQASIGMLSRHHNCAFLQQHYTCSWTAKSSEAQTIQSSDLVNDYARTVAAKINGVLEKAGCSQRAVVVAKKKTSNLPIPAEQAETGFSRIEMSVDTCHMLVQALSEQNTQRAATLTGRLGKALSDFASTRPKDNLDYARQRNDTYRA